MKYLTMRNNKLRQIHHLLVFLLFLLILLSLMGFSLVPNSKENVLHPDKNKVQYSSPMGQELQSTLYLTHTVFLPIVSYQRDPLPFGVQTYTSIGDSTGLPEMVALQAIWVRYPVSWQSLEPVDTTPDNFNWDKYDQQFLDASSNHLRLVATVGGNPSWAAEYGGSPVYPQYMSDYLEFIGALVERYDGDGIDDALGSPVVNYWEFYNEPDNGTVLLAENGFGYWGYIGNEYAQFMSQVYPVVKTANPNAKILNGGLSYDAFIDDGGRFVRRFLDDFLAAGGGNYIDIFNFHYYPNFADEWNSYGQGLLGKTNFLRAKLTAYGWADKPMAITEVGTNSDVITGGSDEKQSCYVVQVFSRAIAGDLKIVNWFNLYDITAGFPFYYGLLYSNFQPKPSYYAYQVMTTQLSDVVYIKTLSAIELGSAQAEGYVYQRKTQTVYVVWTNDDSSCQIQILADSVTKVDKYGVSSVITDASDGVTDGQVIVAFDGSPIYIVFGE